MREFTAMLGTELESWPQVRTRPMFGMTGYYAGDATFAALPKTRTVGSPRSFMFKLRSSSPVVQKRLAQDARVGGSPMQDSGWVTFEVGSAEDLRPALRWLERAYEEGFKRRSRRSEDSTSQKVARRRKMSRGGL